MIFCFVCVNIQDAKCTKHIYKANNAEQRPEGNTAV